MVAELALWLLNGVLALSAGIVLVLVARRSLRRHFGVRVAYAGWLLPPALMAAVSLPAPVVQAVRVVALDGGAHAHLAPVPVTTLASHWPTGVSVMVFSWALGAFAAAALMAWRHHRFVDGLGPLQRLGEGSYSSECVEGLPALVGLVRPRVVLPADFQQRYSASEQALMLAHEDAHRRRGDPLSNGLLALLQCVFWFNPLVHAAAGPFRHDQELACDAAVLARHPGLARHYAEAMLKTRLANQHTPLACHWGSTHPLKERIQMLKLPAVSPRRRAIGTLVVACCIAAFGAAAWAAQPATDAATTSGPHVDVTLSINVNGQISEVSDLRVREGASTLLESDPGPGAFFFVFDVRGQGDDTYLLSAEIRDAETGVVLHSPRLVGQTGGEFSISMHGDAGRPEVDVRGTISPAADRPERAQPDSTTVGSGQRATYNTMTPPDQPRDATGAALTGTVVLKVMVDADGAPFEVTVDSSSGHPALDAAATDAVSSWRFNPATSDGEPVGGTVMVPVRFAAADEDGEQEAVEGALDTLTVRDAR